MASVQTIEYVQGSELPSVVVSWKDDQGVIIDLTGYTFELRTDTTPTTIKITGITGAATDPNVTIDWAAGELDAIVPGAYSAQLWARRTSDSKDRVLPLTLRITAAIT